MPTKKKVRERFTMNTRVIRVRNLRRNTEIKTTEATFSRMIVALYMEHTNGKIVSTIPAALSIVLEERIWVEEDAELTETEDETSDSLVETTDFVISTQDAEDSLGEVNNIKAEAAVAMLVRISTTTTTLRIILNSRIMV